MSEKIPPYTNAKQPMTGYIATILQWILNIALILLAIILICNLVHETYFLFTPLLNSHLSSDPNVLLEGILVFFLYFEFIALIIKYFHSGYHFPLRYFLYIGITAIIRLIIVNHENANNTLLFSIAILVLLAALFLAHKKPLKND